MAERGVSSVKRRFLYRRLDTLLRSSETKQGLHVLVPASSTSPSLLPRGRALLFPFFLPRVFSRLLLVCSLISLTIPAWTSLDFSNCLPCRKSSSVINRLGPAYFLFHLFQLY